MHGSQRLTVDGRIRNQNTFRYQWLVLLFEVDIKFRTNEGHDSLLVSLGTYYQHLVAHMEHRVAIRDD